MSKKQNPKKEQKPKEKEIQIVDDFFTQFLEKRKRYWVLKLDEIGTLEKSDPLTLKPDQKEKINNKTATLDKMKYFDDIKMLYFEAHAKKGVSQPETSTKISEIRECLISDLVNLFAVGKAIHNFEKNSNFFEHVFDSDQMTTIQDLFNSLVHENASRYLEESKQKLRAYAENDRLRMSINQFLASNKLEEERNQTTEEVKVKENAVEASIRQAKKPLFHHSSEDEEEGSSTPTRQNQKEERNKNEDSKQTTQKSEDISHVPTNLLTLLPEGDDKKGDDFKKSGHRTGGHKSGNRYNGPSHKYGNNNYQRNEKVKQEDDKRVGEFRQKKNYNSQYVKPSRNIDIEEEGHHQGEEAFYKKTYQRGLRDDQKRPKKEFENNGYTKLEASRPAQQYKQKDSQN